MTHNHNGTHLLVQVPKGAHSFSIVKSKTVDFYTLFWWVGEIVPYEFSNMDWVHFIPPATYGQPFLASEAGEEMAKGVVEYVNEVTRGYKDYENTGQLFHTPTASLHSLCRSKGWEPGETIVIPILK